MKERYSFCESVTALPLSKWHIRKLTAKGQMFGGGVDTVSLCGHINLKMGGWDLNIELTDFHLENNACKSCLEIYRSTA